ncbi:MAG: cyclic nucleotide-binding domain-containing protein [Gammaproteobacteria bacterium]|nr:cyclic nucleotide-binding domain-containing protein [Gammaproteobacteria bacterium]
MQRSKDTASLAVAVLLNTAVWAGVTIARTYLDVLFLSTYPTDWLPFYFMGQAIVVLVVTLGITPLSIKGSPLVNFSLFLIAALSIVAGYFMLDIPVHWFAFGFSLWLAAITVVLIVTSTNAIADAFNVRKFKRAVVWSNVAGNAGGLVMGLSIPVIIGSAGTEALPFILAGLIVFAAFCFFYLHPVPNPNRKTAHTQSPFNYPLFRTIALTTFFLMVIETFSDYLLKLELAATFSDKEDIGMFMGPFYGIASVVMLSLQLVGTQYLLRFAGVVGLLTIIPWYCGISGLGLILYPGLMAAAILRMGQTAFRFSFYSIGREIGMQPLPAQVRRAGKMFGTALGYLGAGVAAAILWLFAGKFGPATVPAFIILVCIIWIITAIRINKTYQATLAEAIKIKRFNVTDNEALLEGQNDNVLNVIAFALKEKDPDSVRFGFALLEKYRINQLPEEAMPHINSEYVEIRADFVDAASRLKSRHTVPILLKRLAAEQDGLVIWRLLKGLSVLDPCAITEQAKELLTSTDPLKRAGAVVALFADNTLDNAELANNTLKAMIVSSNPMMRKGAAYAISALSNNRFQKELSVLLQDTEEVVSIAAIWAVSDRRCVNLCAVLTARLGTGKVSRYAIHTLINIGAPAVPHLAKVIKTGGPNAVRAAIRGLTSIPGESADLAIVEAAKSYNVMIRTKLAKGCSLRLKHRSNSDFLVRQAREFVDEEVHSIRILKTAKNAVSLSECAKAEIAHRQKLAEARLLYWFDVVTQSVELSGIIPSLLQEGSSPKIVSRHAAALEFLEIQTNDNSLKKAIAVFEEPADPNGAENAASKLRDLHDTWLTRVLDAGDSETSRGKMDITTQVMLLRKARLFRDLPGEILLTIAETCQDREMVKGEKLFVRGDASDGMYVIASGEVDISRDGQVIAGLHIHDFFGEIGLFDDSPRSADAVAKTDGMLLFLEKAVFDSITEDLPEILRTLVRIVIGYLK